MSDLLAVVKALVKDYVEFNVEDFDALHTAIADEETRRAELAKGCPFKLPVHDFQYEFGGYYVCEANGDPLADSLDKDQASYLAALINSTAPPSREKLREIAGYATKRILNQEFVTPGTIVPIIYRALCEATGVEPEERKR